MRVRRPLNKGLNIIIVMLAINERDIFRAIARRVVRTLFLFVSVRLASLRP